jgi:hypothetical protein
VRLNTELAERDSGRSKTSKPRLSRVAVDATGRDTDVGRKSGGWRTSGGDQRARDNGKEGQTLEERVRLHGARTP